jgi:hypothetical protein
MKDIDMDIEIHVDSDSEMPTLSTGIPKPTPLPSTTTAEKRAVLSQEAHGTTSTRTCEDESTLLEVDHMIFDYLLHQAITTYLRNAYKSSTAEVDLALVQVEEFLALFNTRHSNYTFDPELRFRQLLLQLISLLTQRFVPHNATPPPTSLSALRARNSTRAQNWIGTASRLPTAPYNLTAFDEVLPLDEETVLLNRKNFLRTLKLPDDHSATDFYGSPESVSLLDLLPLFPSVHTLN